MATTFRGVEDSLNKNLLKATEAYFKQNQISRKGNWRMYAKTAVLFCLYLGPYITMMVVGGGGLWMLFACLIMGIAVAGIGMSVMHDACHGAYSSNRRLNLWLGFSMNMLGGNRFNWIIQHNVKHHTFTNIYGKDEDLENGDIIRMSPHATWKPMHRYQHFYSWFLYGLGTLSWVTIKDFKQLYILQKEGSSKYNFPKEWSILITTKAVYYFFMIALPIYVLDVHWAWVVLGFVLVHLTGGIILSITFQLAHLVEGLDHAEDPHVSEISWAEHQLRTTSNFARGNPILTWFMGGLNYQVEHHLFPSVCHIHYPALSKIVRQEAGDMGIDYNEHVRFRSALQSHYKTLKEFGRKPAV